MKIRDGFVSNSSSSSFIIQLKKPIQEHTLDELKTYLQLDKLVSKWPYCDDKDLAVEQLFDAILNSTETELPKYKAPYAYEVELGDLYDMEHLEEAYALMHDFPSKFLADATTLKIANENIAIIDLGC